MAEKAPARAAWIQSERVETKCAGCSKQLRRICRTVCRRCQTPYCGPGCAQRHESAHSLVCRKIAQGISDEAAPSWPPQAGAKVEYELNGRWFPGCISMASPTTLYFRYAARCLKNEEPIERDDLARLRPQRRLRRGSLLLHGWPAAVVELLGRRLPEPLAFAVAGYACGRVRAFGIAERVHIDGAERGHIECPILTPDGKCLVVATARSGNSDDFFVKFYSLESGECVRTLKNDPDDPENYSNHLAEADWVTVFFPGGGPWQSCDVFIARLDTDDAGAHCCVVDLGTGEHMHTINSWKDLVDRHWQPRDQVCGAYASSKTRAHAVTANQQDEYKIHDLATGDIIRSGDDYGYNTEIYMRVSPDGSRALLMFMDERASVESWSLGAQGAGAGDHHVLKHSGSIKRLCPTNDAHVLTMTGRELRIWDRTTGKCVRTISQPSDDEDFNFMDVCVTPDGARAVTASCKTRTHDGEEFPLNGRSPDMMFRVWDLNTGERVSFFRLASVNQHGVTPWEYAVPMDITPDGNWLIVRSEGSYGVYWI